MFLIFLVSLIMEPLQEGQQLSPDNHSWLKLAQPLMSPLEWQEAQKLSDADFASFQATWIQARRPLASKWPAQGLNLPAFYAPKQFGDQRDTVFFLWGDPQESEQRGNRLVCSFNSGKFLVFEQNQGKWVLEKTSQAQFAESQIIRRVPYSTGHHPFGATRIPPELTFGPALIEVIGREPNRQGQQIQLRMLTPAPFFKLPFSDSPRVVECLVTLNRGDEAVLRHTTFQYKGSAPAEMLFSISVPPGFWQAEILVYSGSMRQGFMQRMNWVVPENCSIGQPVVVQNWIKQNHLIAAPFEWIIEGVQYQRSTNVRPNTASRVLLPCGQIEPEVWLITETSKQRLAQISANPQYRVYDLGLAPEQGRIIAMDPATKSFSSCDFGDLEIASEPFILPGGSNLSWTQIPVEDPSNAHFVYVVGQPWFYQSEGNISWLPGSFPNQSSIQIVSFDSQGRREKRALLSQEDLASSISVRPNNLVIRTTNMSGEPQPAASIRVSIEGQTVTGELSPITSPKAWGVIIEDRLLSHWRWPEIKSSILTGLKTLIGENDTVYLVLVADRPEMWAEPSRDKTPFLAQWTSLKSRNPANTDLDMRFLLEALAGMNGDLDQPHHVLFCSPGLGEDLNQWQEIVMRARSNGIHLYHLEFEMPPESGPQQPDLKQRIAEANTQTAEKETDSLTEDFQEERNTRAGFRWTFGRKNAEELAKKEEIREAAARASIQEQLELRSVGRHWVLQGPSLPNQMNAVFRDLAEWVGGMRFFALPRRVRPEQLQIQSDPNTITSWTLVPWTPLPME